MKSTILTLLLTAATAVSSQSAETKLPKPVAELFPLAAVRLLDPELLKIRELDHQYLLALDSDRLLRNYRENFDIKTGIPELTGHEAGTGAHAGARGHYTGHYLSACAMMIASTGDAKLKAKADAMVAELAKLQQPNGYLSAQPEKYFDDLERNPAGRHITWYCQHKLLAGLLDMYVHTGNAQALEVARKFGDWVVARTEKIDHALMQKILHWEFGGIGEAMANLAAITGDARYLQAARRFDHDEVLKPLAAGEDILKGHHGNTEIPKFIAAAREYELTGEEPYQKAAAFFWQQVALHRSYATGGNTVSEHFCNPPDVLSRSLGPSTQESCNTYNMLKLTEHVFGWNPRADAGDYYERALYNHILATPHPETGMPLYWLGLAPGQWKVHFVPHQSFWCCAGTGLENFSKLQRGIYYHGQEELWVNLFIASELDWKEKGLTLRQQTTFPNEPGTTLRVQASKPMALKINIRIPYWTKDAAIEINGEPLKADLKPASFATIDRTWNDGDTVKVSLPMRLHLQPTPDDPKVAAVMVGPLVLAGELGPVAREKVQVKPDEYNGGKLFQADPYPEAGQLALAGDTEKLEAWLEPVPGRPLTFKTKGAGRPRDFVLSPFYRLFDQRYNVYWRLQPPTTGAGTPATGNTRYVINPENGDDANPPGKPWRTFKRLSSTRLAAGDIVEIAPGRQEETLTLSGQGTEKNPVIIRFLPGTHVIGIKNTVRLPLFISNACDSTEPKPVGIWIQGARHFRLEGGGVSGPQKTTILYDGRMAQIFNDHSEDIAFQGLVFDLKRPTVSEFRVLSVNGSTAVIQVAEGSDYAVENGKFLWKGDWGPGKACQEAVPDEGRCWRERTPRGWTARGQEDARATDLGHGQVRLDFGRGDTGLTGGHQYHFRSVIRDLVGVHTARCKDIAFRDCDFYALTGMGFVSQFTENMTVQRLNVAPPAGTLRTCPAWADIFQFSNCKGSILVEGCRLSGMQDDSVNCHGTYLRIVEKTGNRQLLVRFVHPQTYGFAAFAPGDEVAVMNAASLREYPGNRRGKVQSVERITDKEWRLTFEGALPDFQKDDLLDNITWNPDITIANNKVDMDPVRGFLLATRGRIVVTNNSLKCFGPGVLVEGDGKYWMESSPIRDMLVETNEFIGCSIVIGTSVKGSNPLEPVHENIRILNNSFRDLTKPAIQARLVKGLVAKGNRADSSPAPVEVDGSCSDLQIDGN